jgi:hypothetical protein
MVDSHFSSPNQAGIGSRSELNDQAENHNAPTTMAALARGRPNARPAPFLTAIAMARCL